MNRNLAIAVAAFFSFITAVVAVVLYYYGFISNFGTTTAVCAVFSACVLLLMLFNLCPCADLSCRSRVKNALCCFGRPLVFAAVLCFNLSLAAVSAAADSFTHVAAGLLFAQVFLAAFTAFMLAFLVAAALPQNCSTPPRQCTCICSFGCDCED